jgi:hypothetical protein
VIASDHGPLIAAYTPPKIKRKLDKDNYYLYIIIRFESVEAHLFLFIL